MSTLTGAHHNVLNNPMFIDQAPEGFKGAGLKQLRGASIPGASHDSSERYPPPICHPGTRKEYIEKLTQPPQNPDDHVDRITWFKGPAGVGKSAIAQSCADALYSKDKLGASFFFSRPNHRDNPDYFFTSLAYQLAVKHTSYGTYLDKEIGRDPTTVTKSLPHQFNLLFIIPFAQPAIREEIGERVIIVDGLDECARAEAQVDIIKIVAKSVQEKTTPFNWIFLSRLEPKIVATFDLPDIKSITQRIDLPVSREIDKEILLYLADKLKEIGHEHDYVLPWPSEEEVWTLVDFYSGLFACAHAIIYFVGAGAESLAGPVGQLHVVLQLANHSATKGRRHPLSALDQLYTLIMECVSLEVLQAVQWILVTTRVYEIEYAFESSDLTGLSESQLRSMCRYLHSVLSLDTGDHAKITFYHASFMDFLEDPTRSGRFYLWSDCAITLLEEVLHHLDQLQINVDIKSSSAYTPQPIFNWSRVIRGQRAYYTNHIRTFFKILTSVRLGDDVQRHGALTKFDFRKPSFLCPETQLDPPAIAILIQNLGSRLILLRPCTLRNWGASFWPKSKRRYYYHQIGNGKKKALLVISPQSRVWMKKLLVISYS